MFIIIVVVLSADQFKAPARSVEKPFRLCVSDVFKGQSLASMFRQGPGTRGQKVVGSRFLVFTVYKLLLIN